MHKSIHTYTNMNASAIQRLNMFNCQVLLDNYNNTHTNKVAAHLHCKYLQLTHNVNIAYVRFETDITQQNLYLTQTSSLNKTYMQSNIVHVKSDKYIIVGTMNYYYPSNFTNSLIAQLITINFKIQIQHPLVDHHHFDSFPPLVTLLQIHQAF